MKKINWLAKTMRYQAAVNMLLGEKCLGSRVLYVPLSAPERKRLVLWERFRHVNLVRGPPAHCNNSNSDCAAQADDMSQAAKPCREQAKRMTIPTTASTDAAIAIDRPMPRADPRRIMGSAVAAGKLHPRRALAISALVWSNWSSSDLWSWDCFQCCVFAQVQFLVFVS